MILHSSLPLELVLAGLEDVGRRRREVAATPPGLVLVDLDERGRATINRLVTTDPAAYLDPRWTPGTVLDG